MAARPGGHGSGALGARSLTTESLDGATLARWREAMAGAGYTVDGVAELLGDSAAGALARHETVPAERATRGGSPAETLVRLFLLQREEPLSSVARALPLDALTAAGVLTRDGDGVRAALDVRPYGVDDTSSPAGDAATVGRGPAYVVSDLGTGLDGRHQPLPADHVLGVGGASTTLAQLTVRARVGSALDLGTGCGVQALHLSGHAEHVTATDVLPRALAMARLSAALSGVVVELVEGDLLEPVAGRRFDLVVSNPPFVVGAGAGAHHTYRDSGLPGDEVCRRLVASAPDHLTEGGWCQLLANWVHRRGEDWRERVTGWLPAGCDAWVVQREEVADPAEYVGLWLRDSGEWGSPGYREAYDAWLSALERDGVEGVGFGYVTLRRTGAADPVRLVEDWPHAVEQPLGPAVAATFAALDWLRARDDATLLAERLSVAADVTQETSGRPGADDPATVVLRQHRGMRRAHQVDTETAALVGACEGEATVGVLVDAVAAVLEQEASSLRVRLLPRLRELVRDGLLVPTPG